MKASRSLVSPIRNLLSTVLHSLVISCLYVQARVAYRVRVRGLANFTRRPSTVVLMNHRRDMDGGLVAATLSTGRGFFSTNRRMHYAIRDDLFRAGFLARYALASAPAPLRRALRHFNVAGALMILRCRPVLFLPERTVYDSLLDIREALCAMELRQVLTDEFMRVVPAFSSNGLAATRLRNLGRWPLWLALQRHWNPRDFRPEAFSRLKAVMRENIEKQLDDLASVLRNGDSLLLAPEGRRSLNGSMKPVRRGLGEVLARAGIPARLLPVCVTYDSMTAEKPLAFVQVGPEIDNPGSLPVKELESTVENSLKSLGTVTMANLASAYLFSKLRENGGSIDVEQMGATLFSAARDLAGEGRHIDPRLLEAAKFERCFRSFLRFCRSGGIVTLEGNRSRPDWSSARWTDGRAIDYGRREFEDIAPGYWAAKGQHPTDTARVS